MGTFKEILKQTKVTPIFKKRDQQNCGNYRFISLLSNITKIIEKLIHKRLYGFIEVNDCLYAHQYGFRNQHSTVHALIAITEKIKYALGNGKITCGIFLDPQKAFDTVDYKILISKLEHYGICRIPLNWFKSYLTKRRQFVEINNAQSETVFSECGVPQGSVLEPLLLLIYINDLHNATNYPDMHQFADDTNLLYSSKSLKDINKKIISIIKTLLTGSEQTKLH